MPLGFNELKNLAFGYFSRLGMPVRRLLQTKYRVGLSSKKVEPALSTFVLPSATFCENFKL